MTLQCPAKLNLYLKVLAREETGYHQIETLFQRLDLEDTLTVSHAESGVAFECSTDAGEEGQWDIGPPEENTVVRAARSFLEEAGISSGVSVRLTKRIPAGTGLGGASSDAAGALLAMNRLFGEPVGGAALLEIGGRVGADVPFFLTGATLAWAWGRGGRVLPIRPLPPRPIVVVVPSTRISTAQAYAALSQALHLPRPPERLPGPDPLSWDEVSRVQWNDFEGVAFPEAPGLQRIREDLERGGAFIARMTGSGSALFGVFDAQDTAESAAHGFAGREDVDHVMITATASSPA
ncbi:MAG: 4-(cytidine 5'-diphospho)-2-C-methyl-D-erythritol kinase [Gemmatimonadota bacterium]|nr:4-(cytidine 5'-diphospho)-2-C-methyl-D-erythritol kinase [Gemmatimonadota bacterium]